MNASENQLSSTVRLAQISCGGAPLRILAAGGRVALALPRHRGAALTVVNMYQPQRLKGNLFRLMAQAVALSGRGGGEQDDDGSRRGAPGVPVVWLSAAVKAKTVGFLRGNPAHGPRCILAGIDPVSGGKFVAKLGLDESAVGIRREAAVLRSIWGRFPGVVEPLSLDEGEDWALLRLPHLDGAGPRRMSDPKVRGLLQSWLREKMDELQESPWFRTLVGRVSPDAAPEGWHERLKARWVCRALMHGDFAPWNMRGGESGLVAIDWEWATEEGIAGIDLVYGLRQEALLVKKLSPERAVRWMLDRLRSPLWAPYLQESGWSDAAEDCLRLGLLHSHFNAATDSADLLAVLGISVDAEE